MLQQQNKSRRHFPCPCGRMTAADCAGECGHVGACIVCGVSSLGGLNGVEICLEHWDEVAKRILTPARYILRQVMEADAPDLTLKSTRQMRIDGDLDNAK